MEINDMNYERNWGKWLIVSVLIAMPVIAAMPAFAQGLDAWMRGIGPIQRQDRHHGSARDHSFFRNDAK